MTMKPPAACEQYSSAIDVQEAEDNDADEHSSESSTPIILVTTAKLVEQRHIG
jgi:hypothetical protein